MYLENVLKIFEKNFEGIPLVVKAPGRINLIGEHTDYNEGYVLPAAIEKAINIAIVNSKGATSKIIASDINDEIEFDVNNIEKSKKLWANYILGVIDQLKNSGKQIENFNAVFGGDIPIGAGLSSSAALETGFAFAFNLLNRLELTELEIIKYSQMAEHNFVGVKCGIMDQFASVMGKRDEVIQLDCRSLEYKYFPFNFENISILLFDTCVSHSLASSEYGTRRLECEEGVKTISKYETNVKSLRDVSSEMLNQYKLKLTPTIFKRCEYVVEENSRLLLACEKLEENDLATFGKLMFETHEGLQNKYEVSCKELDFLVENAKTINGIIGARMMGGGFGGCTINLIENEKIDSAIEEISRKYESKFLVKPKYYITKIVDGTTNLER